MGKRVELKRPDGETVSAYAAEPAQEVAPGVVVVQEWWGVNEHIQSIVDRLAEAGYRAIAPDLYHGRSTRNPAEANAWMGSLDWNEAVSEDIRAAARALAPSGKVAVLGFCMGGALTLMAAAQLEGLSAAVCFYGIPPAGSADLASIEIPVQAHFAMLHDNWCTPKAIDALEQTLERGNVSLELHRYQAQHAFFNDTRPEVHDANASRVAWTRTLDFLNRTLRGREPARV